PVGAGSSLPALPRPSSSPPTPPAPGPHAPAPLDAGVYATPPAIGSAIHSLEHAAVIVWYDPAVGSSADVAAIRQFFAQGGERNHVIVAPYSYPQEATAGALPSGRTMAARPGHHVPPCDRARLAVAI